MLNGQAQSALNRLNGMDVSFATLSLVRGECYYVLRQWREAAREFEAALRLSPNSPRAEMLLILSHEMLELSRTMQPAQAIVPAMKQFSISAKNSTEEDAPFKSALPASQSARPVEPVAPDEIGLVSETLAELMIKQGKVDEARKVYIQLARLNPDRYEYFRKRIEKLEVK